MKTIQTIQLKIATRQIMQLKQVFIVLTFHSVNIAIVIVNTKNKLRYKELSAQERHSSYVRKLHYFRVRAILPIYLVFFQSLLSPHNASNLTFLL